MNNLESVFLCYNSFLSLYQIYELAYSFLEFGHPIVLILVTSRVMSSSCGSYAGAR